MTRMTRKKQDTALHSRDLSPDREMHGNSRSRRMSIPGQFPKNPGLLGEEPDSSDVVSGSFGVIREIVAHLGPVR